MTQVIGFDFDECLTQAYTIVPFIVLLEKVLPRALPSFSQEVRVILIKSRDAFYKRVALHEIQTKGTLFRPSLLKLLPRLLAERQTGQIQSLFLYSNNAIKILIDTMDYILGLVLQQNNVPVDQFITEPDGLLHVLSPRAHIDDPCRSSEQKESNGFREKSFEGIANCLNLGITPEQLWYLDDTRFHDKLMKTLKERYIVVKSYNVKVSNIQLVKMFIESFPTSVFKPSTQEGIAFLPILRTMFPKFVPTGRETQTTLTKKLVDEVNSFSPQGKGRMIQNWKEKETNDDFLELEKFLQRPTELSSRSISGGKRTSKKRRRTRRSSNNIR